MIIVRDRYRSRIVRPFIAYISRYDALIVLPNLELLDIFSLLACEDVLYAFGRLNDDRLLQLISEHGAFQQICLSSQMTRRQYYALARGVWRYDLVRSFVCKDVFSELIVELSPCPLFPSLAELRILSISRVADEVAPFVIAHSSTLTHLTLNRHDQCFDAFAIPKLLLTVIPHLHRLQFLGTDLQSGISVISV